MSVEHRSHGCNHRDPTFPDFGFTRSEVPAKLSIVDLPQLAEDRGSSFMPHRQHSREVLAAQNAVTLGCKDVPSSVVGPSFSKQTGLLVTVETGQESPLREVPERVDLIQPSSTHDARNRFAGTRRSHHEQPCGVTKIEVVGLDRSHHDPYGLHIRFVKPST